MAFNNLRKLIRFQRPYIFFFLEKFVDLIEDCYNET